ncbi:MAG: hypothetical protein WBP11_13740 [Dokdonella sp.]
MINLLLIAVAWGSLLLPLPRWLFFILSFIVLFVGTMFVLFGALFVYWDSHMQPENNLAMYGLVTGILIVLSRATWLVKGLLRD